MTGFEMLESVINEFLVLPGLADAKGE